MFLKIFLVVEVAAVVGGGIMDAVVVTVVAVGIGSCGGTLVSMCW